MSLFHVANNTGIALYPLVGGLVGLAFGWRATFAVTVVAGRHRRALILLPLLLRIQLDGAGRRRHGGRPIRRSSCTAGTGASAVAVTNFGVVANMIHRHGFRNTILPLYAATALGLGGLSRSPRPSP